MVEKFYICGWSAPMRRSTMARVKLCGQRWGSVAGIQMIKPIGVKVSNIITN